MKAYHLRLDDEEMEALKKDAHRHEMNISDYLRTLIKNQREVDAKKVKITSKELADEVLEDNRPFDYAWIRHVRNTKGYDGLLNIARTTVEGYAPEGCSPLIVEKASRIIADTMDTEIK